MPRTVYVDGRYLPHADAFVHVEDRGYQLADGVYEVVAVANGRTVDLEPHLDRLDRSLAALAIDWPMSRRSLMVVIDQVVRRNRVCHGMVYLQVTRGVAPRDHAFPRDARSVLVVMARSKPPFDPAAVRGVDVITIPDIRWKRCDIKSIALLPNLLGKQAAKEVGAFEAWMIDDAGLITEGTSSNAWIVTRDGELLTRHLDQAILGGITRASVLEVARGQGIRIKERPFSVEEAKEAREAFLTSTTTFVKPVIDIDGTMVGDGKPGALTLALLSDYAKRLEA